jgi:hypothetical protein
MTESLDPIHDPAPAAEHQGLANDKAIDLPELWQKIHPLAR